mmetsp:Transcript_33168/g.87592  ORF Transcript_33168/g.87592 Transcript_33168/m.87592 type:complete len:350 (+) Transcript_33168:158-1207(+)
MRFFLSMMLLLASSTLHIAADDANSGGSSVGADGGGGVNGGGGGGVDGDGATPEMIKQMMDRLEQLEKLTTESKADEDYMGMAVAIGEDEKSLLEVFGDAAKTWLLNHLAPTSDKQCQFNWKLARCEPRCLCSLQYRFGDYTVGRSCRMIEPEFRNETCDPLAPELSGWRKVSATGKQVATSSKRAASKAKKLGAKGVSRAKRAVEDLGTLIETSAPATDDCGFNLKGGFKCDEGCSLQPKLGDYSFRRACRVAPEKPPEVAAPAAVEGAGEESSGGKGAHGAEASTNSGGDGGGGGGGEGADGEKGDGGSEGKGESESSGSGDVEGSGGGGEEGGVRRNEDPPPAGFF